MDEVNVSCQKLSVHVFISEESKTEISKKAGDEQNDISKRRQPPRTQLNFNQMRAAVLERLGSLPVLKDVPDPQPSVGDAVIQVLAVPLVSYAKEIFLGTRQYPNLTPLIPGSSSEESLTNDM